MATAQDPGMTGSARDLAREVLIHGPISRSDLGRRLGLSPASLTRLSKPLIASGLFIERAELQGATGRPTKPLDVNVDSRRFVGIKLTGSDAQGVATDLRAGVLSQGQRHLDGHDVGGVVEQIARLVNELADDDAAALAGIGISVGGKVTDRGVITRAPFLDWRNVPLASLVADAVGVPVAVENDVTALAKAEQWFGAVRGTPSFAVVTVGAGVGYGLVMHDQVLATPDSGLGLGGHIPLDPSGPLCTYGHRGCSTAMLSIPSITAQVGLALGREVSYSEVLELAAAGHPVAVTVTDAAARSLGRMLAGVANLAMVNTIVLSGEGIALWRIGATTARAALQADRDPEASPVALHIGDDGFTPWARGAAAVAIQAELSRMELQA
jgi:predicted NBD/HSP70 family sugar kinase